MPASKTYYSYSNIINNYYNKGYCKYSLNIIVCVWYLSMLVLMATYCGNLTAFLAVETVKKPANTLLELSMQNQFSFGCIDGGSTETAFKVI